VDLEIFDSTLEEHFWFLFKYETNIYHTTRWFQFKDKKEESHTWITTIAQLVKDGKLPRQRVLKEALAATTQSFNRNLINWYLELAIALAPTQEEWLHSQKDLFHLFHSAQSKPINTALKVCKKLVKEERFEVQHLLEVIPQLMTSEIKAIIRSTLILLEKIAKQHVHTRPKICLIVCAALTQTDEAIQLRAAKIISKYGDPSDAILSAELQLYIDQLKSEPKAFLATFSPSLVIEEAIEEAPLYQKEPQIQVSQQLRLPQTIDDFIFLLSQAVDGNEAWHFDGILAAVLEFHPQMTEESINKLAPAFQRAYKLLDEDRWNNRVGTTDTLLAIFLIEYMEVLRTQFEKAHQLNHVKHTQEKKEHSNARRWSWYQRPSVTLKSWKPPSNQHLFTPFKALALYTLKKLKQGDYLPLLSTPSHVPCWIDPLVYVQRLGAYQAANKTPNSMDWQIAISRVSLENTTAALELAQQSLTGELLAMTNFLLKKTNTSIEANQYPEEWTIAAFTKSPIPQSYELPIAFNSVEQHTLLGEEPYQFSTKTYLSTRYNYTTRKQEPTKVTDKNLSIGYSKNRPILQKLYDLFVSNIRRKGILHQYMPIEEKWLPIRGIANTLQIYLQASWLLWGR